MERYSCQRKFCIRPEQTIGESPETWKRGSSLPPVAPALHHTRMVHTKQVLGDRSKNSFRRPTQQISWSVLTPVVSLHSFWERNFSTQWFISKLLAHCVQLAGEGCRAGSYRGNVLFYSPHRLYSCLQLSGRLEGRLSPHCWVLLL